MSRFTKYFSFLSKNPQIAPAAVITASITFFGINFLPHTLGISKYREFMQAYKSGAERELSEKTHHLFENALDIIKVSAYHRKQIKPFVVYGFDTITIGSTSSRFGVFVGIPTNYSYEAVNDIDKTEIVMRDKPINWDSKQGKILENALVLSEEEKVFGIVRAILEADSHRVILNSVYPFISLLFIYTLAHRINSKLNLLVRPFAIRGTLYSFLIAFGYGLWSFMKDFTTVQSEASVDKQLAQYGPEFVTAGIKFYNKLLEKNIAIRELTGDNTYTAKGNINYFVRQKALPLTLRKQYFENIISGKNIDDVYV